MGQGYGVAMSCGADCRRGLDLALLWLWCWLAAAALILPVAWEPPYVMGMALKSKRIKKLYGQGTTCSNFLFWSVCQ